MKTVSKNSARVHYEHVAVGNFLGSLSGLAKAISMHPQTLACVAASQPVFAETVKQTGQAMEAAVLAFRQRNADFDGEVRMKTKKKKRRGGGMEEDRKLTCSLLLLCSFHRFMWWPMLLPVWWYLNCFGINRCPSRSAASLRLERLQQP